MSSNETYRATGAAATFKFVVVTLLGIAAITVVMTQLPKDVNGALAFGLMVGMALVLALVLFVVVRGGDRRHARAVEAVLAREGFAFCLDPTLEQQTQAVTTIGRLALLAQAPAYVTWVARRTTTTTATATATAGKMGEAAGESVVLRHAQVVGSGKGTHEVVTMVAAVPTPSRAGQPVDGVWLTRTNWLQRRDDARTGAPDIQLGEKSWDDAYRIQAHDAGAPARLLAIPGARELIAAGPARESWAITPTHTLCIFGADTTPDGVAVMLRRATRMAALAAGKT
jgi:hypothetical protein